jgi:hypothetical protein
MTDLLSGIARYLFSLGHTGALLDLGWQIMDKDEAL